MAVGNTVSWVQENVSQEEMAAWAEFFAVVAEERNKGG